MVRMCRQNNESVAQKFLFGNIDLCTMSKTDFVDDIILAMHKHDVLQCLEDGLVDKRASNTSVPYRLVLANSIAAKMKSKTSLTDIPTAISDHKVLAELGFVLIDTDGNLRNSIMRESGLRYLLDRHSSDDWFNGYNMVVQNHVMPLMDIQPDIHILDTTLFEVNIKNKNYEDSTVGKNKQNKATRGYKLATIRGIVGDSGIIEEIKFGDLKTHDAKFCRDMLMNTPVLKSGDILINDRGFIDRKIIDHLKLVRNVDVYIPLKANMIAYKKAVAMAIEAGKWIKHPNPKRINQKIAFVEGLGKYWKVADSPNVDFNACVVHDFAKDEYFVFITTDLNKTAKQIVQTYELRPEIEEDYRQLKDFWEIESFKSTRLHKIAFHVVMMLFGYLFFQLFTLLPEGGCYQHKSLPIIMKNYEPERQGFLIFFAGNEFGIFSLIEFAKMYSMCEDHVREKIGIVMGKI